MTATFTEPATFNQTKAEGFADRFVAALNESSMMLLLSIGHRTGLFDTLDGLDWSTSAQIAAAAGLQERYVREWLGGMVTSRVIEYRPNDATYRLPAEHARWLTRRAAPENLAVTSQWFSVLGHVESEVVEKFKHGGGVHYGCFHRFHETMAEESGQTVVAALRDYILPLVPGLASQLEAGIRVLDVGCGSGWAACALAKMYPSSTFAGYDLCEDAIAAANAMAREMRLTNIRFEVKDLTTMHEPGAYDLITAFDIVHDQKAPAQVLDKIYESLKPGSTFLMQDIAGSSRLEKNLRHPVGTFGYTISTMHCMTVSLAQGGAGLGTMWGEELAQQMLEDAGFRDVQKHKLSHDFINVYYVMLRP